MCVGVSMYVGCIDVCRTYSTSTHTGLSVNKWMDLRGEWIDKQMGSSKQMERSQMDSRTQMDRLIRQVNGKWGGRWVAAGRQRDRFVEEQSRWTDDVISMCIRVDGQQPVDGSICRWTVTSTRIDKCDQQIHRLLDRWYRAARPIGCLNFLGRFPQKSPMMNLMNLIR